MTAPLRTVLVGAGARGRLWARVMNDEPGCEVAAYVDPSPPALQAAVDRFAPRPGFGSLDEALATLDDVDAVLLATPPKAREVQLEAAYARGLAVLAEKPLALDLALATRLVRRAEAAGVPLMVGLNFRYLAVTAQRRRLYRDGVVGRPEFTRFTYERWRDGYRPGLNRYPLTMRQPMLWEQSIHHFDLLRYVYGREPESVACRAWNPSWSMYEHEANVAALFTFAGGLVASYQGTWQSGWSTMGFEWRTDCTEGVVTQLDQFGELRYARRDEPELTEVRLPSQEPWVTEAAELLRAFIASVQDGAPLACSGRDHLSSLAMVQACIEASDAGTVVDVRDVLAGAEAASA